MKVAIMQPYFLPYIGYFQLIAASDVFVVYDRIKYTKKGWINRNRFLQNGSDAIFSLPLKKGSDHLDVVERELATDFDRTRLLAQFKGAYQRAPYFHQTFPLLEEIVRCPHANLFDYILHSIDSVSRHLNLRADIRISSTIPIAGDLKGRDKVLAICNALGADRYINAVGGMELYDKNDFASHGIALEFIKARPWTYAQFAGDFVPWLSIIDVLMFSSVEAVRQQVANGYELI